MALPTALFLVTQQPGLLGLQPSAVPMLQKKGGVGEEAPCSCSSCYADRAGEGSRYQTTAGAAVLSLPVQ